MTTAVSAAATDARPSKALHISLWSVQILLAVAFGMAGVMKTTTPIATLAEKMAWVAQLPWLVRFIGISELAAAIGLIFPSLLRIKPALTSLAALGLVVVMILATGFHLMRGEAQSVPATLILGGMAAFVAWGRWKKAPIAPRA